MLDANPFFAGLPQILESAVARPSGVTGEDYNQVSTEVYNAVHQVLSGKTNAEDSLANLERRLERLAHRADWGG